MHVHYTLHLLGVSATMLAVSASLEQSYSISWVMHDQMWHRSLQLCVSQMASGWWATRCKGYMYGFHVHINLTSEEPIRLITNGCEKGRIVIGAWACSCHSLPLCSAAPAPSSPTVFSSHTAPTSASNYQPANNIFLSHHSSHQLQFQPSEQSVREHAEATRWSDLGDD